MGLPDSLEKSPCGHSWVCGRVVLFGLRGVLLRLSRFETGARSHLWGGSIGWDCGVFGAGSSARRLQQAGAFGANMTLSFLILWKAVKLVCSAIHW